MRTDALWRMLLKGAEAVRADASDPPYYRLEWAPEASSDPASQGVPSVFVVFEPLASSQIPATSVLIRALTVLDYRVLQKGGLSDEELHFLLLYLPYIFLPRLARTKKRAISIAHFAQSLDGRIATLSGDSRWIGNEANLDHAHRMRALCEGVLVGRQTLETDKPRLNVRRVEGPNPVRIVLGSGVIDFSSLLNASREPVLVFERDHRAATEPLVRSVAIPPDRIADQCAFILEHLYQLNIHSVLIEGGASTSSRFLVEKKLDLIQLHVAPMILGSGRSGFDFSGIHTIANAIRFRHFKYYQIGLEMMFCGEPEYGAG